MQQSPWARRSLSFWVSFGMALAVLPLVISALVVHVWLHGQAIAAFDDVAARARDEVRPLQRLQVELWEATVPVEEFALSRAPRHATAYREQRVAIERGFQQLDRAFGADAPLRHTLERAQQDWVAADRLAGELVARSGPPGDPREVEQLDRFDGLVAAAADKLRAIDEELVQVLDADHDAAVMAYERSNTASVAAAVASLLLVIAGVALIRRVMLANVARLVDGARRFAAGERGHRIEVQVPPELREVADEFNRMIVRIHDAEDSLVAQARQDALTGLDNRRSFEEALTSAFARLKRRDERFVLLFLDVDHFKNVNDTRGHAAGDDVLREIARTLGRSVREVDRVFRVGGEEFAAVLADTNVSGAERVAERVRAAVASTTIETAGAALQVTVSIGLATAQRSVSADELLRRADEALYAAKTGGRNRVCVAAE